MKFIKTLNRPKVRVETAGQVITSETTKRTALKPVEGMACAPKGGER